MSDGPRVDDFIGELVAHGYAVDEIADEVDRMLATWGRPPLTLHDRRAAETRARALAEGVPDRPPDPPPGLVVLDAPAAPPRRRPGPPPIITRERVERTRDELATDGKPHGPTAIARALHTSERTVRRRLQGD